MGDLDRLTVGHAPPDGERLTPPSRQTLSTPRPGLDISLTESEGAQRGSTRMRLSRYRWNIADKQR
jgi:hypothetical protein